MSAKSAPPQRPAAVRAVLLLGPTGSGKTPQGRLLEQAGLGAHFDFGSELRAAAGGGVLAPADTAFVARLLETCALLPQDRFDIAQQILDAFLRRVRFDPARRRLILNGLPRHAGQARDLARSVLVEHVFVFDCDAEAVRARVARRRGGSGLDDFGRADDHPEAVALKLRTYETQTAALVGYYAAQPEVRVVRIPITAATDDRSVHRLIVSHLAAGPGAE